jgi:hypothetical protein
MTMTDYMEEAAALYRDAAKAAGGEFGNARSDRLLRAADGFTALAAIERGVVPPGWGPPVAPQGTEPEAGV